MLAGRKHGDDCLGTGDRFLGRRRARGAARLGAQQRILAEIEGAHLMPRLGEVRGHPAAHVAEPDECDLHDLFLIADGRLAEPRDHLAAFTGILVAGGGEFGDGEADQVALARDAPDQCDGLVDRQLAVGVGEIGKFGRVEHVEVEMDMDRARSAGRPDRASQAEFALQRPIAIVADLDAEIAEAPASIGAPSRARIGAGARPKIAATGMP